MSNKRSTYSNALQTATTPSTESNASLDMDHSIQGQTFGNAAFWRPRHMKSSAILGQIPFLFWLIEATAPRKVVQWGLDDGISYLAVCQACERLNAGTICLGINGENPALKTDILTDHDECYGDFSHITDIDKIPACLPERIDFLIICGSSGERSLSKDVLPRLSGSAVVVVINADILLADGDIKNILTSNGQICMRIGSVVPGGTELDVILYGTEQPERLRRLAYQSPSQSQWLAMRQAFKRLGQGLVAAQVNRDMLRDKDVLVARLKRADVETKSLADELQKAESAEIVQNQRQAEMAAQLHDLQIAADLAKQRLSVLQFERDDLATKIAGLLRERDDRDRDFTAQLLEMRSSLNSARAENDARVEDIAVLTKAYHDDMARDAKYNESKILEMKSELDVSRTERDVYVKINEKIKSDLVAQLSETQRALEEARADNYARIEDIVALTGSYEQDAFSNSKDTAAQLTELNTKLSDMQLNLEVVSAHRDALLNSTSWKITLPLRKLILALRR